MEDQSSQPLDRRDNFESEPHIERTQPTSRSNPDVTNRSVDTTHRHVEPHRRKGSNSWLWTLLLLGLLGLLAWWAASRSRPRQVEVPAVETPATRPVEPNLNANPNYPATTPSTTPTPTPNM